MERLCPVPGDGGWRHDYVSGCLWDFPGGENGVLREVLLIRWGSAVCMRTLIECVCVCMCTHTQAHRCARISTLVCDCNLLLAWVLEFPCTHVGEWWTLLQMYVCRNPCACLCSLVCVCTCSVSISSHISSLSGSVFVVISRDICVYLADVRKWQ